MAKRIEIDKDEAQSLMTGKHKGGSSKPKARGKKRRTEIQHDVDLETKMEKHIAEKPRERRDPEHDSKVDVSGLRAIAAETIARVYEEIWPGMSVRDGEEPNDEIKEEAYILGLTMIVGNNEDTPRRALKIRDVEISGDARYCTEHAA